MFQFQVLRKAREDMQKSANWYDKQTPGLGDRFLLKAVSTFRLIDNNPLHYQERFSKIFRLAKVHHFPFRYCFQD